MNRDSIVQKRQQPLMESYVLDPKSAWITDVAIVEGINLLDPFHTSVIINEELKVPFQIGVHRAVGGDHDFPNPGDMLCAALAVCFESSLRMISNRFNIELKKTKIRASAKVDVRGTLMVDRKVPVGFQSMELDVEVEVDSSVKEVIMTRLLKASELCCIIFQTLQNGIPIHINKVITYTDGEDK